MTEEESTDVSSSAEVEKLYAQMELPADSRLGNRVYKKLFAENAQLGITDKKAFSEDIDKVVWMYKLEPDTVSIPAFSDSQREYFEIAVMQVDCKTQKRTGRIAQIIHRAIPYPLLIIFSYESSVVFSLAHKRFSQSEKGAIVADEFFTSDWIDLRCPTDVQESFLASLKLSALPHNNLFAFYSGIVDRMTGLDCARLSGQFAVGDKESQAERLEALQQCRQLETQIAELKAEIKKEDQFNRRVELNVKIKELEQSLNESAQRL